MFTDDSNANAENEGGDSKVALDSRPPHGSKNSNGSSVESSEVELLLVIFHFHSLIFNSSLSNYRKGLND